MENDIPNNVIIRRVPVGLSQSQTFVQPEPGEYDVSVHTKLQSSHGNWALTGVDVTLNPDGDLLQPMLRAIGSERQNSLLIVADAVRVEGMIHVPGIRVRIQARVLDFAKGAQISTQANPYTNEDIPSDVGANGRTGRFSGPVELFVGTLNIDENDTDHPVIVTDGTDGTIGGPGQPGTNGPALFGINFEAAEGEAIQTAVNTHRQWLSIKDKGLNINEGDATVVSVSLIASLADDKDISVPSPVPILNGLASEKLPGIAGQGSVGAYITASSQTAIMLDDRGAYSMEPGKNAEPRSVEGGAPGTAYKPDDKKKETPVKAVALTVEHDEKFRFVEPVPEVRTRVLYPQEGETMYGEAAPAMPNAFKAIQVYNRIAHWFHPLHTVVFSAYLTELSRGGYADQLATALESMAEALAPIRASYRRVLPDVEFDDDESQSDFQQAFDAIKGCSDDILRQEDQDAYAPLLNLQNQIAAMKDKATRGLDHYGNPAGWAPNLSIAAEMDLERGAGENAVRALYVSQWLSSASDKIETMIEAHWQAILEVRKRRHLDFGRQAKVNSSLASLASKSERLKLDIETTKSRLDVVVKELTAQAKDRVMLAAAVDIIGSVMTIVPYGQPALGMVGKAVKSSSEYIKGRDPSADHILNDILDQGKTLGKKGIAKRSDHFKKQAEKLEKKATTAEGAKYWDKYKGDDQVAFDTSQAEEAEEAREAAKVPKARAAQWSAVSDNFADAAKDIYADLSVLAAPEDAAKKLLKKLEAKDPAFIQFSKEIEDLNLRKTQVVGQIISAHVELAAIASDIAMTHHLEGIFIDALADASYGRVNTALLGAADQMKTHALNWLVQQRYKLVKAYEALFLEPCPIPQGADEFGVNWLVDQFEKTVTTQQVYAENAEDSRRIWETSLEALKGYLAEFSNSIARSIVEKLEGEASQSMLPSHTAAPITIELSPDQLAILNEGQKGPWDTDPDEDRNAWPRTVSVNLGSNSYFPFDHDKVVIRSITVRDCVVSERPGADTTDTGNRSASVVVQHFGNGILKHDNTLFAVRYGKTPLESLQSETADQEVFAPAAKWQFSYDEHSKDVTVGGGYAEEAEGLIQSILGALTQDHSRLEASTFLRSLPAWTELMITAQGDAARWAQIDKLVIEVHLDSVVATHNTCGIDLRVTDDSEWPVTITREDGQEENFTTPALILGDPDTKVTLKPDLLEHREIVTIDGRAPTGDTWDVKLRRSEVFHPKMAEEARVKMVEVARVLPPPSEPLDWDQGAFNLMVALKRHIITKHEPVWNPHHGLGYAYSFVARDGTETNLSPWLTIRPVKYCFTKLLLPVWTDHFQVRGIKLYRRVCADYRSKDWGEVEEIFAYEMLVGSVELVQLPSAMINNRNGDHYTFYDGAM
ncbi:hypothetical protein L0664_04600 [Octadecabacter sp. G9-8]|uniref:Uncharacterized protein n=1 Tax=Octadecabacter dasysiphoniae TaxID=2909341 RepID=A0ABS9CU92_9RHOB|nr:hypothetical protein [Octadecabacter dasysiphoniae]MCF2870337.1 hypothetical protein [Octadecabacter dasysiphoniae]